MHETIFVNSTFATDGGVKTILDNFINVIKADVHKMNTQFVFFVPQNYKQSNIPNNMKIININAKKWNRRIFWDFIGLKRWSIKNNTKADTILSLQNTSVNYYKSSKQILYIQQPIPFEEDIKWSFYKKEERKLWFYKTFYLIFIKLFLRKNDKIIVQTNWMKRAILKKIKKIKEENIYVIKPSVEKFENFENIFDENDYNIFFPAMEYVYKNHMVLVEALKIIREEHLDFYKKIKIYFTLGNSSDYERKILDKIREYKLVDKITFMGKVAYSTVLNGYNSCNLMAFPSYIETFGLPLIEAAQYGVPIIASDREFSREVIGDYEGVTFVSYNSPRQWAEEIIHNMRENKKYDKYTVKYETSWEDILKLLS